MLSVGSRLAPIDWPSLVLDLLAVERNVLAVALHCELLKISRKSFEVLLVRQDSDGLRAKEVVVPKPQQTHQHRQISLKRRSTEVLVHLVEAVEHGAEVFGSDRQHGRKADGRIHRVASADPIPELEHIGG